MALAAALALGAGVLTAAFPGLDKLTDDLKKVEDTSKKVGKVAKGATGLSLEEEIAIGDAVSLEIAAKFGGLWRDEAATRRVNLLGRALGRYAHRQDLVWRFGILDSDTVNAFSAPGGRVFITRGLYRLAETDDELAGVLAHEIIHIDRRHALRIIARGELLTGVTELVKDNNADYAQYEQLIGDLTSFILEKGYDPESEYEADKRGRALANVTGFAPGGLRAALEDLKASGKAKEEKTFDTHPPLDERLKRLPKDPKPAPPAS
ncbi:MAG: M48 family metalloprotease [Opitutaceae bacterium]|nr:M48 family metalloprotease [Opitutaceae bacterium]